MNKPLVSIVIPCYNHEDFIQDSIKSVIDQEYENIELLIIDDGSSDNSVDKIEQMVSECENRFKRFEFKTRQNIGLSRTLNESLEWCRGEYFSALASDDQMLKEKTKIQIEFLESNPAVPAVMSSVSWIDNDNNLVKELNLPYQEYSFEEIFLSKQSLYACTQISRLQMIKSVGGYKDDCAIEDWYMWLKLSELGSLVSLSENLVNYRVHADNTIKKGDIIYSGMIEAAEEYKLHPLYFKAVKQIIWIRVAAIILRDKSTGARFFKEAFEADKMVVFNKNFYRCLRNFVKKPN